MIARRYDVGKLLGRGPIAEVFEGFDTKLHRKVAIKLLDSKYASKEEHRRSFASEARTAARLSHKTIVKVFDAGEYQDEDGNHRSFIVMELVQGKLLTEVLQSGPLRFNDAERFASALLDALSHSQKIGIIHRAIKPDNIMLSDDGSLKVMDYGIAKIITDETDTLSQTASGLGTAAYMSPEQAQGSALDARSDLYSAAVVIFEMLTGRTPFIGKNAIEMAMQHIQEDPLPPSVYNKDLNPVVDRVILKALSKNPDERYQNAGDFKKDLVAALEGKDGGVGASDKQQFNQVMFGGSLGSEVAPSTSTVSRITVANPDKANQKRPPVLLLWGFGILVIALIGALTIWILNLRPLDANIQGISVPDIANMSEKDGSAALIGLELRVTIEHRSSTEIPEGNVIGTIPDTGAIVDKNTLVTLVISSGPERITLGDYKGMTANQIQAEFEKLGLILGSTSTENSPDVATGRVMGTDPAAGNRVSAGQVVNVIYSTGQVSVPNVVNMKLNEARALLTNSLHQLFVTVQGDDSCVVQTDNPVKRQSLAPGNRPQKSEIILYYCSGTSATTPDPGTED